MSKSTTHFKIGLLVILGAAALLAIVTVLSALSMRREKVAYWTFFNESVQGLDTGAPVKFRGVTIGTVARIEIAPDHRHVAVKEELDVKEIQRMGLAGAPRDGDTHFLVPPELRAQLGSQGITGVKFITIDFFDPKTNPLPELPFRAPHNYIPAAASLMKNLETTVMKAMERLPELVDASVAIMNRIDRMATALEDGHAIEKTVSAMNHADEVMTQLSAALKRFDRQRLPERAAGTIDELHVAVGKMNKVLDRLDGETGLLATAKRSVGDMGRSAVGASRELDDTLRDVREAAEAIRSLAEALDRDPDMLIKGHAKGAEAPK